MGKRRIAIEHVVDIMNQRKEINDGRLEDIIWTLGGEDFHVDEEVIDTYSMLGLNNCDFIMSKSYLLTEEIMRNAYK